MHENQFKIMWKHVAMKAWNEKKLQKKDFSEFASSVLDANLKDQKEISSNSKESDVDDCDAQPKKPRIAWKGELHCQFVKAVMHIGLDSMINTSAFISLFSYFFVGLAIYAQGMII